MDQMKIQDKVGVSIVRGRDLESSVELNQNIQVEKVNEEESDS